MSYLAEQTERHYRSGFDFVIEFSNDCIIVVCTTQTREDRRRSGASRDELVLNRGLILAFKTRWKEVETIESCFREVIEPIDDRYRPNGICIIDTCTIRRLPYKLDTKVHREDAFLHFFIFLLHLIQSMPGWLVDFEKYFESYGEYNREDIS